MANDVTHSLIYTEYEVLGCFKDTTARDIAYHTLVEPSMTHQACVLRCASHGWVRILILLNSNGCSDYQISV